MNKDKDLMMILLELEKNIVKNYSNAITEASSDNLTEKFTELFNMSRLAQRDLFNLINSKGWYNLEYAEVQKISQEQQKLNTQLSNLGGCSNEQ